MSLAPSSYPHLWRTLVSQELAARYRGSLLGRAWPILLPLLMLAIYGFVFGVVFRSRWPGLAEDDHLGFTLNLFAGLLVHGMLAETVGEAPGLLLRHSNFVRKVVFPLPVLVAGLFFFCLLTALMMLRPARDALGMERGIDSIRWLFVGTALVTLLVNPVFGWLVSRLTRWC